MYKTRLGEPMDGCKLQRGYTETDPSGRYGRFRDILGKGAMKTVYRAFDEVLGMEVAWNQVKLNDVFRSPEELQRLYSEVHLLKSLNHDAIMRFYASWIDVDRRTFNFITEMFTSGTLREYRQRYNRVNIRAIKNWARQILKGLACLHSHDPPVIHRDLKCDNIFVNGHLGQVKIGDLGLAAILRGSQHAHSVIGTPEFMAPELYEENYNELVDIYSFGMCVLEMLSCEYPYSECSNPAQIYKKVTSGKLPEAFFRMEDAEAQKFVRKCLENASKRPSASELLEDPFLIDDEELHIPMVPNHKSISSVKDQTMEDDSTRSTGMKITGTLNPEDDTIFLKIQISDKNGGARNIYFPFDTMNDTALDVATEMVRELEITDWESFEIAEMIDEEISALVPTWKEWEAPKNHHHHHQYHYQDQHSFKYDDDGEDDDDERIHNPFYSLSSHSSSQASLSPLLPTLDSSFCGGNGVTNLGHEHDWLQEDLLINDDDASSLSSSINSYKYSNLYYCSRNESDFDLCTQTKELNVNGASNAQTCTRVYPEQSIINKNCNKEGACNTSYKGMTKIRSLVDMRSQLLHRSLVEQINKRRLFKTVGAVENIGYHEPVGFSFFASDKLSMGSTGGSWRCARDR